MAAILTTKQLNVARDMVTHATALWDAVNALTEDQLEYLQSGTFDDSIFTTTDTSHLTAYLVGLMLSTVAPALATWFTTALPGGTVPRDIFLQVRS